MVISVMNSKMTEGVSNVVARLRLRVTTLSASLMLLACVSVSLLGGCAQVISPLSPADSRLPSAAKQRIADAEDAVVIARSRARDARAALTREQTRIAEFESRPPKLGAALNAARQLNSARLARADLESKYAAAELALSESRLTLIYAQTSLRYDLAVYDLTPLDATIEVRRATLLKLRRELKSVRADVRERRSAWWTAYQQLARSGGTQPYWVHEFSR